MENRIKSQYMTPHTLTCEDMALGETAVITDAGPDYPKLRHCLIMRVNETEENKKKFVLLNNPTCTWYPNAPRFKIRRIPSEEVFTIQFNCKEL